MFKLLFLALTASTAVVACSEPVATPNDGGESTVAPSACRVDQTPDTSTSPVAPGTSVRLTVVCAGGAVTAYQWAGGSTTNTADPFIDVAPAASTFYSVVASNRAGFAVATTQVLVIASAVDAGMPDRGATDSAGSDAGHVDSHVDDAGLPPVNYCTVNDLFHLLPWPASGQVRPSTSGFSDEIVSFQITVPYTFSPPLNIEHLGFMRIAEVPGSAVTGREITVSRNACDFQSGNYLSSGLGTGDTAPAVNYTVNNPDGSLAVGGQFNLMSGDTVYFNVRNYNAGAYTCPDATCEVLFDFATPNRY